MPILEYKCANGHTTEKLFTSHLAETAPKTTTCKTFACGCTAKRVEFPRTGSPILKEGKGGFYKPSI